MGERLGLASFGAPPGGQTPGPCGCGAPGSQEDLGQARVTSSVLQQRARVLLRVQLRGLGRAPLLRVHDEQHVDGHGVAVRLQLHGAASFPARRRGCSRGCLRCKWPRARRCLARERARARERALPGRQVRPAPCFADSAKFTIRTRPGGRYPPEVLLSHL